MSGLFILNSVLLGVGLAMDAFSVSLANGLANHFLRIRTMCLIAGTFGFFQWLMPMTGWVCVNRIVDLFRCCSRSCRGHRWSCSSPSAGS